MIATFELNEFNFVNIKISLMLLLQVKMVVIFKLTVKISVNNTHGSNDGRHIQA